VLPTCVYLHTYYTAGSDSNASQAYRCSKAEDCATKTQLELTNTNTYVNYCSAADIVHSKYSFTYLLTYYKTQFLFNSPIFPDLFQSVSA